MSREAGAAFERLAADYLVQEKGFRVLCTNYTCKGGEIDLVCDDQGTLVFVEVRARKDDHHGAPEETVGGIKRARLLRAARHYLMAELGGDEPACRFDVVAVEGNRITHFPDAFGETSDY